MYKKYKTCFAIEKGEVIALGIIEPDSGMFDEEVNYPLMDLKVIRKGEPFLLIAGLPRTDEYSDILEQYGWDEEKAEFIKTPAYKKQQSVKRNYSKIKKVTDSSIRVVVYDEFAKKEEKRIAEEKRKAEAAERKRKEGARQKEKAENKKAGKENIYSQIKPGMTDWQVKKKSGLPVKREGSSCGKWDGDRGQKVIWSYSVERDRPCVEFVCKTILGIFELSKVKID